MAIIVNVINATRLRRVPTDEQFRSWVGAALRPRKKGVVDIRIATLDEIAALNQQYRAISRPTNVLAFPADIPDCIDYPLLGDLVICAEVVRQESSRQRKTENAHWAHLTIHGTLHLIGHDHQKDDEAKVMEALETRILHKLGHSDPYQNYQARIGA